MVRQRLAALASCLVLAACQTQAPATPTDFGSPEPPAALSYNVTLQSGAVVLRTQAEGRTVEAALDADGHATPLVALPGDRFALLTATQLAVIDAHANTLTTEAEGCLDVTASRTQLFVLCPGSKLGGSSSQRVRLFDFDLKPAGEIDLRLVSERAEVSSVRSDAGDPTFVGAGDKALWIAYPGSKGGHRWGTRLIVQHDLTGRAVASAPVDGVLYNQVLSPDGRYLAASVGGSSGACHTVSNLRVVDLVKMTLLNTAPDTPAEALVDSAAEGDVYFTSSELRWTGPGSLVAYGSTAHHDAAKCDEHPRNWQRSFDVSKAGVTDREGPAPESGVLGWLGPDCDDVIASSSADLRVLKGVPLPERCRP